MGFAKERFTRGRPHVTIGTIGVASLVASAVAATMRAQYERMEKGEHAPLTAEQEAEIKTSVAQSYETRQQRRHRERMAAKQRRYRRGKP